jgi:hypothetical protein
MEARGSLTLNACVHLDLLHMEAGHVSPPSVRRFAVAVVLSSLAAAFAGVSSF